MDNDYHFATYILPLSLPDGRRTERNLIVIKKGRRIVRFTDFHRYCFNPGRKVQKLVRSGDKTTVYVCQFLNYIFFEKFHIRQLTEMTARMFRDFMDDFGTGNLNKDLIKRESSDISVPHTGRGRISVEQCSSAVMSFIRNVIKEYPDECHIRTGDLYTTYKVRTAKGNIVVKKRPSFTLTYDPEINVTFRDVPEKIFYVILNHIIQNHKDILMLVANGAFAGLRPSESCNVRREDSALGPGIIFHKAYSDDSGSYSTAPELKDTQKAIFARIYGNVSESGTNDIEIDLSKELVLRSDMANVGAIKKERFQHVYTPFVPIYQKCYDIYMDYIEGSLYEAAYGPLTIGRNHMAMTYSNYLGKIRKVIQALIPVFLDDDDQEVVEYGHMLLEYNIAPHIFRHWFTVQLVLYGESVSSIQYWRGDTSPESAISYLNNKTDLMHRYKKVNDELGDFMLWRAKHLYGEK